MPNEQMPEWIANSSSMSPEQEMLLCPTSAAEWWSRQFNWWEEDEGYDEEDGDPSEGV